MAVETFDLVTPGSGGSIAIPGGYLGIGLPALKNGHPEAAQALATNVLDTLVRRSRAKLTPDRARYIAHPDWVATQGASPPADLWHPERDTGDALAETVRWYRGEGWL